MIRCPNCNALNRDGSRFCNECGTPLQRTQIRCPNCGTLNPVGNIFCDRCNARLVPSTGVVPPEGAHPAGEESAAGVKGISLPARPVTKQGAPAEAELPDWLLELTDETAGTLEMPGAAEEQGPVELPDWVSGLTGLEAEPLPKEEPSTEQEPYAPAELPDWLSGLIAEGAEEPAAGETATPHEEEPAIAELPDWLSGFAGEEPPTPAPPAAEKEPEELPDWLSGFADETPAAPEQPKEEETEELPGWLSGLMGEEVAPEPESAAGEEAPEELPRWVAGLRAEAPEVVAAEIGPADSDLTPAGLPEWMSDQSEEEAAEEEEIAPTELPDWLSGLAGEEAPGPVAAPELAEGPPAQGIPPWLLALADKEPAPIPQGPKGLPDWLLVNAEPEPPGYQERVPKPLPAWLPGVVEEALVPTPPQAPVEEADVWLAGLVEAAPSPEEPTLPEAELPEWLSGLPEEEPKPEAEAAPAWEPAPGELPDWLSGILAEEPAPTVAPPLEEAPAAEELPDWLAGLTEEAPQVQPLEAPPAAELPDWLAGSLEEEPTLEEAAVLEGEFPAAELPDWLAGLGPEEGAGAGATVFTEGGLGEPEAPKPAEAISGPDWLKSIAPPPGTGELKPVAPAFVPSEEAPEETLEEFPEKGPEAILEEVTLEGISEQVMPEWLQDLTPAPPGQVSAEEGPPQEDASLVRAEVPMWLQGLKPPGTGPLPPLPEAAAELEVPSEGQGGLARAEIPEWMQSLRPTAKAEGEVLVEKAMPLEPAEEAGPLAGLPGILPAKLEIDIPADFQIAPRPEVPQEIVERAQLWQQLLERPRGDVRPVARQIPRVQVGVTVMRLIVAAALLAVAILGLFSEGMSQAPPRPSVTELESAVQALQPGDTVILAVEYGPAEAGEMAPIAETLLEHLMDRQVNVMAVSTVPEGAGLAEGLLAAISTSNQLPEGASSYLPGMYNGVASFLTRPEIADVNLLLVLAARADSLRWWAEQNGASASLPMGAGVSASVGPVVKPYLDASADKGWIVGVPDMVAYRQFRGLNDEILDRKLNALMLTHWAAAGLLLFGLLYYLAAGKKRTG